MQGKRVLITGANSGIGYAAALALAEMGADLVLLCRSEQRGRDAISGVLKHTGQTAELLVCDLSAPDSIRAAVERFCAQHDRLDVLVNNAGAYFPKRVETPAGLELTFAVNHLGPFLLTHLLLDRLKASAPSRVVNLSSRAHRRGRMDFDDLQRSRRFWWGMLAYGDSKLCNLLFTRELTRRLEGTGVVANAMHPGVVATGFGSNEPGFINTFFPVIHWLVRTPAQGADTAVWLASDPAMQDVSGRYYCDRKERKMAVRALDDASAQRLWDVSVELCGL